MREDTLTLINTSNLYKILACSNSLSICQIINQNIQLESRNNDAITLPTDESDSAFTRAEQLTYKKVTHKYESVSPKTPPQSYSKDSYFSTSTFPTGD